MYQESINSIQKHLRSCQKTKLKAKLLPNSRGDNFDNTRNRVIILVLCSTLHIYLFMFQLSINSIQKHLSYCQKTKLAKNFNLILPCICVSPLSVSISVSVVMSLFHCLSIPLLSVFSLSCQHNIKNFITITRSHNRIVARSLTRNNEFLE